MSWKLKIQSWETAVLTWKDVQGTEFQQKQRLASVSATLNRLIGYPKKSRSYSAIDGFHTPHHSFRPPAAMSNFPPFQVLGLFVCDLLLVYAQNALQNFLQTQFKLDIALIVLPVSSYWQWLSLRHIVDLHNARLVLVLCSSLKVIQISVAWSLLFPMNV